MVPLLVIGHLDLPETARPAWHGARLDAAAFAWPEGPPLMQGASAGEHATVGDLLAALASFEGSPDFFERDGVELRGLMLPQTVDRFAQDLATALREAARHGGRGEIAFVAFTEQAAFVLRIGDEDSAQWMGSNQLFTDDAQARRFVTEMEFVGAWDRDTSLRRRDWLAAQEGLGLLPLEQQPHHREILERLLAGDAAVLFAAMQRVTGRHDRPLVARYTDASALVQALRDAEPPARAAAIELLAIVDPDAAMDRLEIMLADPSEHVLRHAVRALAQIPNDAAFERLLGIAGPRIIGFVQIARDWALGEHKAPNATAIVCAALERDGIEDNAVLDAVSVRNIGEATPRVLKIFEHHPLAPVRVAAANVLARLGGPLVEANTQALQFTLMGMGKALNQDDDRRAALLGVDTKDESLGIKRFGDIDLDRLRALVDEGFANPASTQNDSPAIGQFLAMLTEHPELRVGGYAVPITRADYRVSIDGVWLDDLDAVPAERQGAVRELFEQLEQTATNTDPEGSALRCWWT
jgi:hypothetical protein